MARDRRGCHLLDSSQPPKLSGAAVDQDREHREPFRSDPQPSIPCPRRAQKEHSERVEPVRREMSGVPGNLCGKGEHPIDLSPDLRHTSQCKT